MNKDIYINEDGMAVIEPYWNESKLEQKIHRGVRRSTYSPEPVADRKITVYTYKIDDCPIVDEDKK